MSFEIAQLRQFVALAEELHFARAARRCFVTQPAMSRQLQRLERQTGLHLIDRNRRTVRLTAEGGLFLEEARAVLDRLVLAEQRVAQALRGERGQLRLGYETSVLYGAFPGFVQHLRKRLPDITLELSETCGAVLLKRLHAGEIDAALMHPPIRSGELRQTHLFCEKLVAAVPSSNPLSKRKSLRMIDLIAAPQIIHARSQNPDFYDWRMDVWRENGAIPRVVCEADDKNTLMTLVAAGLGMAIVPASFRVVRMPAVRFLPISHRLPLLETVLAWRHAGVSLVLDRILRSINSTPSA
jgi:DNA-binding transcriptional LysR family regulator